MSAPSPKVIVVGGGPVGMTAAHALSRAGIDFVVLERRSEIVEDAGSGLVLSAMGLRALAQLGLLDDFCNRSTAVDKFNRFDHKGRDIGETMFFTYFKDLSVNIGKPLTASVLTIAHSHGSYPRVFRRRDLMQCFWSTLSADAQSKTHANKKVSDIQPTDNGVVVSCDDGTSYEGSMVIGADGSYSAVRKHMRLLAMKDQQTNSVAPVNDEKPFLITYRCFWVLVPLLPNLVVGDANETHGPEITIQFFVGEDYAIMGVYEKLQQPTREPARYTTADEDALVAKWGHLPLTKGGKITLGQAYAQKMKSGLVNLEEGVVKNWSWGGRMVLVGDAAHKFTPSTGAGCNNGIVDVVALANQINRVYAAGAPTPKKLAAAFKEYQDSRYDVVKAGCNVSGKNTAMATWSNFIMKFLDVRVFSNKTIQKFFISQGVGVTANSPVFDYIEGEEEIVGSVPWKHAIPAPRPQAVF